MSIATQRPTSEVISIETAQNRITLLTANAFKRGIPFIDIQSEVASIAHQAEAGFDNAKLERDTRRSLLRHAVACYTLLNANLTFGRLAEAARQNEAILEHSKFRPEILERGAEAAKTAGFGATPEGMPLHYWHGREYIKKRVHPVMEQLAEMQALDPNDITGHNTLRNLAEMEVRYQNHQESIAHFREKGDKLVRASQHEDCSDRCFPWQGRVYSMDGTSGTTEDGEEYVPLEVATESPEVQYTTKAGVVYNNGLLGFNCRHRILEYTNREEAPPPVTKEQQEAEYAINQKQRALERQTREERLRAELYKGVDPEAQKIAADKARELSKKYKAFCKANERAFYPERLKILNPRAKKISRNEAILDILGG